MNERGSSTRRAGAFASLAIALTLGCGSKESPAAGAGGHAAAGTNGGGRAPGGASGSLAASGAGGAGASMGGSATNGARGGASAGGATAGSGAAPGAGTANAGSGTGGTGGVAAGAGGKGGGAEGGEAGAGDGDAGGAWVYGYWAVWQTTQYPLDQIAWKDLTHAAISFVGARAPVAPSSKSPYATLDTSNASDNLGASGMSDFAAAAHAGGTHPLISLGGGGAGVPFAAAASSANRGQFVADVVAACAEWGYDGVDLDWEDSINYDDFASVVTELRAAAPAGFLITVPVGAVNTNLGIDADAAAMWTQSHGLVDQLNVMTYTGSGAYPGWAVWHLDPLHGQGADHPFDVESSLAAWAGLGIPKSKLGVGIGFYGRAVSAPVTAVLEDYGDATTFGDDTMLSYGNIRRYFADQGGAVSTWDATAMTSALSWPTEFHPAWTEQFPGDAGPPTQFLTYEDEQTVEAKGAWVKENGYGGVIIWTINEGTSFPYGDDGYENPLLDATRAAFR